MSTPGPNMKQTLQAEESKFVAWLKRDWAHFVTWLGVLMSLFGKHL